MHTDLASAANVRVPTDDRGNLKNRFGAIPGNRIPATLCRTDALLVDSDVNEPAKAPV